MSRLQGNNETGTGRVFGRWSPSDLDANSTTSVSKENFKLLSSYNWLPHKAGTSGDIIVPGEQLSIVGASWFLIKFECSSAYS